MIYAIISDIHANLPALEAVLARIDSMNVDQVVCLGDVVGYNAEPNECIDLIRERDIPTICGNHDAVACGLDEPWGFNPVALSAALWTREAVTSENMEWLRQLADTIKYDFFLAVHGSPTSRDMYLFTWEDILPHIPYVEEHECTVCMFGHTHSPGIFSVDGMYTVDDDSRFFVGEEKTFFINPGSVGQPRDGDARAAFGILDSEEKMYELVRVEYPVEETVERVSKAGLPDFLGERLRIGR